MVLLWKRLLLFPEIFSYLLLYEVCNYKYTYPGKKSLFLIPLEANLVLWAI